MLFTSLIDWMGQMLLQWRTRTSKALAGQGLVEYALILVLVAVVVIVILSLLGPAIGNIFSNIFCGVLDAQSSSC